MIQTDNKGSNTITFEKFPMFRGSNKSKISSSFPRHLWHLWQISRNSSRAIPEHVEDFRTISRTLSCLGLRTMTKFRAFTEIAPSRGHSGHTEVWLSSAADSSSALCQDFFTGLGEAFIERRKDSVLLRLFRELLEPRWWPGALR